MEKKCDIQVGRSLHSDQSYLDVLSQLSSGAIPFVAKASLPGEKDWVPLLDFQDFSQFLVGKLMLASNGYSYESLFNHWYVKDGSRSFGPFSLIQMLEFYQQKRLHLDNLIRHSSFESWLELAKAHPFSEGALEALINNEPIKNVISRRRNPRIPYTNEVFLSSRAELYRGVTWSLSCQGLGLVTDGTTDIELDHKVNIIVNSNNEHGAVQVKGRVVNIRKETNYERVAVEFDDQNDFLKDFIQKRVPKL